MRILMKEHLEAFTSWALRKHFADLEDINEVFFSQVWLQMEGGGFTV